MTREELIAYLELKAHAFEGHPVHSEMSQALREAVLIIRVLDDNYARIFDHFSKTAEYDVLIKKLAKQAIAAKTADTQRPDPHPRSTGFCQYED